MTDLLFCSSGGLNKGILSGILVKIRSKGRGDEAARKAEQIRHEYSECS